MCESEVWRGLCLLSAPEVPVALTPFFVQRKVRHNADTVLHEVLSSRACVARCSDPCLQVFPEPSLSATLRHWELAAAVEWHELFFSRLRYLFLIYAVSGVRVRVFKFPSCRS